MGAAASKAKSARPTKVPAFAQKPIGQQVAQAQGRPVEPLPKASETKSDGASPLLHLSTLDAS